MTERRYSSRWYQVAQLRAIRGTIKDRRVVTLAQAIEKAVVSSLEGDDTLLEGARELYAGTCLRPGGELYERCPEPGTVAFSAMVFLSSASRMTYDEEHAINRKLGMDKLVEAHCKSLQLQAG